MKKLKTLCAIAGATAMLSGASLAQEQQFNEPKYNLGDAVKTMELYTLTTIQGEQQIDKENLKADKKYNKYVYHVFDRDKDGNADLIRMDVYSPGLLGKDIEGYVETLKQSYGENVLKQFYGENYEQLLLESVVQPNSEFRYLLIDDEFRGGYDGDLDRVLIDNQNENGDPIADGVYDAEQPMTKKLSEYIPK